MQLEIESGPRGGVGVRLPRTVDVRDAAERNLTISFEVALARQSNSYLLTFVAIRCSTTLPSRKNGNRFSMTLLFTLGTNQPVLTTLGMPLWLALSLVCG